MDFDSMQQKVSISGMSFLQEKVSIMGIPFYSGTLEALVDHLIDLAQSEKNNRCI